MVLDSSFDGGPGVAASSLVGVSGLSVEIPSGVPGGPALEDVPSGVFHDQEDGLAVGGLVCLGEGDFDFERQALFDSADPAADRLLGGESSGFAEVNHFSEFVAREPVIFDALFGLSGIALGSGLLLLSEFPSSETTVADPLSFLCCEALDPVPAGAGFLVGDARPAALEASSAVGKAEGVIARTAAAGTIDSDQLAAFGANEDSKLSAFEDFCFDCCCCHRLTSVVGCWGGLALTALTQRLNYTAGCVEVKGENANSVDIMPFTPYFIANRRNYIVDNNIARRVIRVKSAYNMSDAELGETLGVSSRTVEGWRQGRPISKTADKLLTLLDRKKVRVKELS